jgi:hypothetical protein
MKSLQYNISTLMKLPNADFTYMTLLSLHNTIEKDKLKYLYDNIKP